MGTSLAPSPIDRVIHFPFLLARATTSAFCLGDTLQQTTDAAKRPNEKKASAAVSSARAQISVGPSITMEILFLPATSLLISASLL